MPNNPESAWPSLLRRDGGERAQAVVLLAHGAGAGMDHDVMAQLAVAIATPEVLVLRFEFDYMVTARANDKRRPPDRLPKLTDCYQRWIAAVQQRYPELPLYVAGKSMGGRVACVCASSTALAGAFALGYPFHPVGKTEPEKWRWQPLQQAQVPVLIIQGSRDAFGSAAELAEHSMPAAVDVRYLADGDHSFKPRKSSGFSQQQHIETAAEWIRAAILKGR
ncbi:alpha/beta family hydrolase [uncultured Ferrimonas sp.]|uniref:alpha/beta family hydrolase n=1 Tax=uncultured Ferrimonas sp. TaxID=432640 RepID=UPI00262778AB|nr:alpha/beta family hydrolase [uncultured Ferrimonas sp.]